MISFWKRAENFPPVLVRLLARRECHGLALNNVEIAKDGNVPIFQVNAISCSTTWSCCDVLTMRRFLQACRVDFENAQQMERICHYLRKPTWRHLRKSPDWPYYQHLMEIYRYHHTTEHHAS